MHDECSISSLLHAPTCVRHGSHLLLSPLLISFSFIHQYLKIPADMTLLKRSYFADNKGRNELTRLIFAVGGIDYQDDLVNYSEYTAMRDAGLLPWGQLPTLTISSSNRNSDENDVIFGQSCSIARYAARRAGLYPKDEIAALRSDEVIDSWRDFLDLYYDAFFDRKVEE